MNITHFCKLFGISRQGYYQRVKRYNKAQETQKQIVELVKKKRKRHKRKGSVRLNLQFGYTIPIGHI